MNSKLLAAINTFKSLDWESVSVDNILQLPIGTAEQQKIALDGLKRGEWTEWVNNDGSYSSRSILDVNLEQLALFAIRVGVNANRALELSFGHDDHILVQALAARGTTFMSEFIRQASKQRMWTHSSSRLGHINVYLVHHHGLEIPQSIDYLKDWAVFAAFSMGLPSEIFETQKTFFPTSILQPRMLEHILLAIQMGLPATGPFASVFLTATQQGLLSREKALELAFFALDAAARPGDKKVWVQTIEALELTDAELCDRIHAVIPLIATGETTVINRFAPRLIPLLKDELLNEILLAAFATPHKKSIQIILRAAVEQEAPSNTDSLAPWLSHLAQSGDQPIVNLVQTLSQRWHIPLEPTDNTPQAAQGLWRATPKLWEVPTFDIGEVSQEALVQLLSRLYSQPLVAHDIFLEQFYAVLIALAYQNEAQARACFKGLNHRRHGSFQFIRYWLEGIPTDEWYYKRRDDLSSTPFQVFNAAITPYIGRLPCLLSTPSKWDLSIVVSDLVDRMVRYQQEKLDILEPDLWIALGRLDHNTTTPALLEHLAALDLKVAVPNGDIIAQHAGQVVLTYLRHPIVTPPLDLNSKYLQATFDFSQALPELPARIQKTPSYGDHAYALFPFLGDAVLMAVFWSTEVYPTQGSILRQVARRAHPLPPGATMNLLAAQRSSSTNGAHAEDCFQAVLEAWERGLLQPNVADVRLLDWRNHEPTHIALLANALERIAQEGLASVVWPILDDMVLASLKAPRLLSGTAEIVQLMQQLLPEVELAIQKGLAAPSALALPGVRTLAQKSGQSKAVSTAQNIVKSLPEITQVETLPTSDSVSCDDFAETWYLPPTILPYLEDEVQIAIDWLGGDKKSSEFLFTLTLPNESNSVFQVNKGGWVYDLHNENQLEAYQVDARAANSKELIRQSKVWLYWNTKEQMLAVSPDRNRYEQTDGPLRGPRSPLSKTMLLISIAILAQDENRYYSSAILLDGIEEGSITAETVLKIMPILLQFPVVNPSKIVRILENNNKPLSTLWPVLTLSIQKVGDSLAQESPPVWINRILDIAIRYAPYLREAMKQGLIADPYAQWPGLQTIAQSKRKSTAIAKAQQLGGLLGLF